jgi:signal transduction histidine kinase
MRAARTVAERLRHPEYRAEYERHAAQLAGDDASLLEQRLLPDPGRARVRVYATQSTHKTLTSLRQGSMIHVHDQDFAQKVEESFHEAYMTHTSTSPNYQILASLDIGRRQAALEGFELVQKQLEYAMRLRDAIDNHPLLAKYMHCLSTAELIPAKFRASGIDQPLRTGLDRMAQAWDQDEFVLDPSRISLYIGATGIAGAAFKREQLMDKFGIQINKRSRNTVLFMTNIGTTRSSVAYLIEVLVKIARDLDDQAVEMSPAEQAAHARAVLKQTSPCAPLPDFSAVPDPAAARGHGPAGAPAGRAEDMIDALLTLAVSDQGPASSEFIDLATSAEDALDGAAADIGRLGLRVDTKLDPAETTGDPHLLDRMIWNLVDNAVRHNEPAGWIRLRTGTGDATVHFQIANSGPLVPDDAVASLFEPFRRMEGRTGSRDGIGLGLSIVQLVATVHGATVSASSQPAGGLEISVVIPRRLAARGRRR